MKKSTMTFGIVSIAMLANGLAAMAGLIQIDTKNVCEHIYQSPDVIAYKIAASNNNSDDSLTEQIFDQLHLENIYFDNNSSRILQLPIIKINDSQLISFNTINLDETLL